MKRLAASLAIVLVGGCADVDWTRGVYEGVRQRQTAPAVPDPGAPRQPVPDYERYRRERDALKTSACVPNDGGAACAGPARALPERHPA